ncbi:MAG: hypothetical protein EOO51_06960 [Flavobacterium sp.]|nr:MAG: hypothetical protein EOO51_06960 [Flavobacterium sp.]
MIIFSSSIILGFIRLALLFLFLFYLNKKFINGSASNNFLEFFVHHWFKYGSIVCMLLFVTVQLGFYSMLNCLFILSLIVFMDVIGLNNVRHFPTWFSTTSKKYTQKLLRNIETKRSLIDWVAPKRKEGRGAGWYIFILLVVVAGITFGSRFYFFRYDLYSLSGVWINDLKRVVDFDSQIWFMNSMAVSGDLAMVNFYGKLADISPEIALQSMGILESTLLSVLIFWVIRRITPSKTLAPILAALIFGLAYTLTPTNIYFLLQSKPIFLGLAFGLPAMVFLLKPGLLKFRLHNYFFSMLFVFIAIGLIDLFTLFILFPPFILLAGIFTRRKSKRYYLAGIGGYLLACLAVLGIYAGLCISYQTDLMIFIHSNLLSVSSYTYIPQLLLPFERLIDYYQIATAAAFALLLVFAIFFKENWRASFGFLLYFNLLILLSHLNSPWIDADLMNQALSVLMPVVVGILASALVRIIMPLSLKVEKFNFAGVTVLLAGILYAAVYYQKEMVRSLTDADSVPKQVLDAYDRITATYFPFSYAVVNDNSAQVLSMNKHFFMNYDDFIADYPKQDSIYFKNVKNTKFLKNNPQYVIPKSILLFVFKKNNSRMYGDYVDLSPKLMKELTMLKNRGRKVRLFYDNKNIMVYEIVNEPDASRIPDLIF